MISTASNQPRQPRPDRIAQCIRQACELGFSATVDFETVDGRRRYYITGTCPSGHAVRTMVQEWAKGARCGTCWRELRAAERISQHLAVAHRQGFIVRAETRADGSRTYTWVVGHCPARHAFEMRIAAFARGQRCRVCMAEAASEAVLAIASALGYDVTIELRQGTSQALSYLVGACDNGHSISMRVANFSRGARCRTCATATAGAESRAKVLDVARAEGYAVDAVLRAASSRQRLARLMGECPIGHPVDMLASNFASGSRCASCADFGFKDAAPAALYLAAGTYQGLSVVKIGISHDVPRRMLDHRRSSLALHVTHLHPFPLGGDARQLEATAKATLAQNRYRTCASRGISFPGATETFLAEDLPIEHLAGIVQSLRASNGTTAVSDLSAAA